MCGNTLRASRPRELGGEYDGEVATRSGIGRHSIRCTLRVDVQVDRSEFLMHAQMTEIEPHIMRCAALVYGRTGRVLDRQLHVADEVPEAKVLRRAVGDLRWLLETMELIAARDLSNIKNPGNILEAFRIVHRAFLLSLDIAKDLESDDAGDLVPRFEALGENLEFIIEDLVDAVRFRRDIASLQEAVKGSEA